ncbi:MAG: family 16 glycoside hydrolase, partial [Verrucomicrobiota bacterium]
MLEAFYAVGGSDSRLIGLFKKASGVDGPGHAYTDDDIGTLVAEAMKNGDMVRGAGLSAACVACHRIGDAGGVVGPELTSIGTTLTADRITEKLLWPKRRVKEGYTLLEVTMKDGTVHQGYERRSRESERAGMVLMRDLASESLVSLRADRMASRKEVGSAMPSGLAAGLSRAQLADLIRYLISLGGGAEKEKDGFVSIFDGKTLKGWEAMPKQTAGAWTVEQGMIVGNGDRGRGYLTFKNHDVRNFELKLAYRFPGKGNSGISIRARVDPTGRRTFQSYHADLGHLGIGPRILGAWDFHTPGRREHACFRGDHLVIDEKDKPTVTKIEGAIT